MNLSVQKSYDLIAKYFAVTRVFTWKWTDNFINTLSNNSMPYFRTSAVLGAYQYQSIQRTRVFDWNSSSLVIHYDKRRSNGYRDFSGYKSSILNLKYLIHLNF